MMIGARTAAWSKSGYTAKDYGNVAEMLDGIWNSGSERIPFDKTLTTWTSFGGASFNVNSWDDGHFCYPKANSFEDSDSKFISVPNGTSFTVEMVLFFDEYDSNYGTIVFEDANYGTVVGFYFRTNEVKIRKSNGWNNSNGNNQAAATVQFVFDGTSIKYYRNGILISSWNDLLPVGTRQPVWSLLINSPYNSVNMRMAAFRLFETALTEKHLMSNYLLDKARFNLT